MDFKLCIRDTERNKEISRDQCTIVYQYDCCCYDGIPRPVNYTKTITSWGKITVDDVIRTLTGSFQVYCDHMYLERIYEIAPGIVGLWMGS